MSNILTRCQDLEVRESPLEGLGVFATKDIPTQTILEEVPFILFPRPMLLGRVLADTLLKSGNLSTKESYLENLRQNLGFKDPDKFFFHWQPKAMLDQDSRYIVLPLGFGPIYNSLNFNNNADWVIQEKTFVFKSCRDIAKGEEITVFYGYFIAEDGSTYDADKVFFFAMSIENGLPILKQLRTGYPEHLTTLRTSAFYLKIQDLLTKHRSLLLQSVIERDANGQEHSRWDIEPGATLSQSYNNLKTFSQSTFPIIQFIFTPLINATDDKPITVLLKKF